MLDLILKDISDPHIRENFNRLKNFLGSQDIFNGNFELFDVTITQKTAKFKLLHGLTFIPADIISLSSSGDANFYFRFQEFDSQAIYITTDGPVRLRFLAGKLSTPTSSQAQDLKAPYPFVAPGDIVGPSSPGFVYAAVGAQGPGFWLTSEGIPSNVVGVPVLFGDAVVVQAAVGTTVEANYTIGIFQHQGQGIGLTSLGTFPITVGGNKRISVDFPVIYPATNVQLACQLTAGNTNNLKVSLIVKGTAV